MIDELWLDESEDALSLDDMIRIFGHEYSKRAFRIELRSRFRTFQTLNERLPIFTHYALERAERLQKERKKMKTLIDAPGEMVDKQRLRDLYESTGAIQDDIRTLGESLRNHDENMKNQMVATKPFAEFLLLMNTPELEEQKPN